MRKGMFQVLILLITASVFGQESATPEEQIRDLISNSFQEIFSEMDPEALEVYCTEDFLLLETGEVWDLERMRNYLERSGGQKTEVERMNSFDFLKIEVEGKMAWVAYYNKAEFKVGEEIVKEMNWVESATAILTEEGWKLQLLHSTVKKE